MPNVLKIIPKKTRTSIFHICVWHRYRSVSHLGVFGCDSVISMFDRLWGLYIDGLVQERRNSFVNALELRLYCTNPSTWLLIPWRRMESWHHITWRHNERNGVSTHRRLECLFNGLSRSRSKNTSKLRIIDFCDRWPVNFPHKRPVTRKIFSFDDFILSYWVKIISLLPCLLGPSSCGPKDAIWRRTYWATLDGLLPVRHQAINWTHWGRDETDNISQTTFWNVVSSMKMFEFRLTSHWSMFLRVQLTIFQH